ncbi:MAG TPA: hypothetical protein VMF07_11585 [Solirubrobacteraceae bacterium]|nr:hypothetical protein [Solirubrobacteraceae bacterium]
MADPRRFELDELAIRPGTYFHPTTEILVVVDDSAALDAEIFDPSEEHEEDAEWVLISDEVPVDEHARDELLEAFQVRLERRAEGDGPDDDDVADDEDDLEPDADPDDDLD